MPELRKDPVIGRWVIIATERARRPGTIVDLQKNYANDIQRDLLDSAQLKEIYRNPASGKNWKVRVVSCKHPILDENTKIHSEEKGIYTVIEGFGDHEVVMESPEDVAHMADLEKSQISLVLETYRLRFEELSKKPELQYASLFKKYSNGSPEVKCSSYSQIIAAPVIPLHVKEELEGAQDYYRVNGRSVYADLLKHELENKSRIVKESKHFVAFTPFASRFPFEVMILPKDQNCDFMRGVKGKENDLADVLKEILMKIKYGLEDPAFDLVLNTAPFRHKENGPERWKTVEKDFCWHLEIVPRLTYVAGFEKGTGFYICPVSPEKTAEFLNQLEMESLI